MDLLAAARQGFQTVDADPAFRAGARQFLGQWLTDAGLRRRTGRRSNGSIADGKWAGLLDSLLPGPAVRHRRAARGGRHRAQPHEPVDARRLASRGTANTSRQRFPGVEPLRVVLAYDVRQFEDKRKQSTTPTCPTRCCTCRASDFAQYAAGVYAANGIHAHILPPDSTRYLATPELSFAIRYLQAHGGLNMSASHNPPDDNGGKFYDERGGQPVPPDDQIMTDFVDQVTTIKALPWADAVRARQGAVPR